MVTFLNQNLHATLDDDLVIIVHPDFLSEADRLANHHRSFDNMAVSVYTVDQLYNEFSSGGQDITAIRNFMRFLYEKSVKGDETEILIVVW